MVVTGGAEQKRCKVTFAQSSKCTLPKLDRMLTYERKQISEENAMKVTLACLNAKGGASLAGPSSHSKNSSHASSSDGVFTLFVVL